MLFGGAEGSLFVPPRPVSAGTRFVSVGNCAATDVPADSNDVVGADEADGSRAGGDGSTAAGGGDGRTGSTGSGSFAGAGIGVAIGLGKVSFLGLGGAGAGGPGAGASTRRGASIRVKSAMRTAGTLVAATRSRPKAIAAPTSAT
jgi:hypothetical protein